MPPIQETSDEANLSGLVVFVRLVAETIAVKVTEDLFGLRNAAYYLDNPVNCLRLDFPNNAVGEVQFGLHDDMDVGGCVVENGKVQMSVDVVAPKTIAGVDWNDHSDQSCGGDIVVLDLESCNSKKMTNKCSIVCRLAPSSRFHFLLQRH